MAEAPIPQIAPEATGVSSTMAGRGSRRRLTAIGLLLPAFVITLLFSIIPLLYLLMVSLTRESSFFFTVSYTLENYGTIVDRYLLTLWTTVYLAAVSSLLDLIFGYPFAYILVRKVRYREVVRAMMTFPLFGPLYLSFGMHYMLLPNGPLGPATRRAEHPGDRAALPHRRSIGFVFQSHALFPHMTVADNIAFGLSVKRRPKAEVAEPVEQMLELVELRGYGDRMPAHLSGGQQRVALARMLATDPRVLLFDEPLSALDRNLRDTLKYSILALQRRTRKTAIYVALLSLC